jgi:hypothetical protein
MQGEEAKKTKVETNRSLFDFNTFISPPKKQSLTPVADNTAATEKAKAR